MPLFFSVKDNICWTYSELRNPWLYRQHMKFKFIWNCMKNFFNLAVKEKSSLRNKGLWCKIFRQGCKSVSKRIYVFINSQIFFQNLSLCFLRFKNYHRNWVLSIHLSRVQANYLNTRLANDIALKKSSNNLR